MSNIQENLMVLPEGTVIKVWGLPLKLTEDVFVCANKNTITIVQKYLNDKNHENIGE